MRDLFEYGYGPNDVYVATGGYGTKGLQRDWVQRGLFNTPIPEPRAGKGRNYPYLAVIEAALMAESARSGISVSTISAAFQRRLLWEAKNASIEDKIQEQNGKFTSEDIEVIADQLTEFDDTNVFQDNATRYGWMIVYEWMDAIEGSYVKKK
jgi:hypothetical protein